jgi:hypothetical protein
MSDDEDCFPGGKREPLRRLKKVQNPSTSSSAAAGTDAVLTQLGSLQISKPKMPVGRFAEMRASRKSVAGMRSLIVSKISPTF